MGKTFEHEATETVTETVVDQDLMELEFTPLPPEEAADLEDRVYLLGAKTAVRPL